MSQFTVLVWDVRNPRASTVAQEFDRRLCGDSGEWRRTLETPGLLVLLKDVLPGTWQPHLLEDRTGVVVGKLFSQRDDSDGYPTVTTFSRNESENIIASKMHRLIEDYWGRYFAVGRERGTGATWFVRDPQGAGLPCMQTLHEGVHIFFSSMDDCLPKQMRFTVDEEQIAAYVCDVTLSTNSSALKEISFVAPGERVTIHRKGAITRDLIWKPAAIAKTRLLTDAEEATRQVRRVTQRCVWSWTRDHQNVMHNLSGGLDSSVILSCLSSAPNKPTIVCINNFDQTVYGDERQFARLAAKRAGCELVELENETSTIDLEHLLTRPRTPRPTNYQGPLNNMEIRKRIARERKVRVIFDGSFGDQLFYNLAQELVAFDSLFHFGPSRHFVRTAAAVARMDATSTWSVLGNAIRAYLFPHRWTTQKQVGLHHTILVMPEVVAAMRRSKRKIHPWLQEVQGVPPGKQSQIDRLKLTLNSYVDTGPHTEPWFNISPLASQPLEELCLGIPTFIHSPYGSARVLERRAFSEDIPLEIVERLSKGVVDAAMEAVVDDARPAIREFMLDGRMVQRRLLDRKKIEGVLLSEHQLFSQGKAELLKHLETEAWLRCAEQ